MAGSTWPAVPPPARTTEREGPPGCLTVSFTRNEDLPMPARVPGGDLAGQPGAGPLHDARPAAWRWRRSAIARRAAAVARPVAGRDWAAGATATGRAAPRRGWANTAPATAGATAGDRKSVV